MPPPRARGPSIPDLLIAATAEKAALTVLAADKDFDLIAADRASLVARSMRWNGPPGTFLIFSGARWPVISVDTAQRVIEFDRCEDMSLSTAARRSATSARKASSSAAQPHPAATPAGVSVTQVFDQTGTVTPAGDADQARLGRYLRDSRGVLERSSHH